MNFRAMRLLKNFEDVSDKETTAPAGADWIYPAILAVSGVLFFAELLFTSKNLYFRDILNFHYPLRKLMVEMIIRAELPLWNPYVYLGQPLLANPNYLSFYPTNLLHLFLPFNYAFKLHFLLHPLMGGLGVYFLARRLGLSPLSAFAGGFSYQFSGCVLSFLNLYNIVPVVGLMPWLGWAFVGAVRQMRIFRLLIFAFLLALQILALEPLTFQCEIWLLVALVILLVLESEARIERFQRCLLVLGICGVMAVCLAAVQVLPTLELLPLTARREGFGFEEHALWSVHPLDILGAFIPRFFGQYYTLANATSWGEIIHAGREPYLVSFFMGAVTLLLAAASFFSLRVRLQRALTGLALFGLFLGLGNNNPFYRFLFDHLFFLQLGRYPSKYFLLTTLAFALLAALGLEAAVSDNPEYSRRRARLKTAAVCGLMGAALLAILWFAWHSQPGMIENALRSLDSPAPGAGKNYEHITARLQESIISAVAFAAIASLLLLVASRRRRMAHAGWLFVGLIAAEVVPPNLGTVPLMSDADLNFVPDINRYVQERYRTEPSRLLPPTVLRPTPDLVLHTPNRSAAWVTLFYKMTGQAFFGIEQGIQYSLDRSVDFLNTIESDQLVRQALSLSEPDRITVLGRLNTRLIASLGESFNPHLQFLKAFPNISDMPTSLYELKNSRRRIYFASGAKRVASQEQALRFLCNPEFDANNTVILESAGLDQSRSPESGTVRIVHSANRRISCEVQAPVAGWVVLLDSYYPGWSATVDGQASTIERADYAFRAVAVPQGAHHVEFDYSPRSFRWGVILTISAMLVLVAGCVLFRRRF